MSRHDQLAAPLNASLEGHHFTIQHLSPRLLSRCVTEMCIGFRVTMTGEMLDTPRHTCILQTLQVVRHHRGCHGRIVAESPKTDDDVLWIGVHVGHRRKVDVEAIAVQVGADGVAALVGVVRITRSTDGTHRLILLDVEVRIVGDTGHTTAFLVDTEQRTSVQSPYLRD